MNTLTPYETLSKSAHKLVSRMIRNVKSPTNRMTILSYYNRYQVLLNEVKSDYPNALITEIKTTVVNRLRHQDPIYRNFMRKQKSSKEEYTNQFLDAMTRLTKAYPFILDEVNRQIHNKVKRHDIIKPEQKIFFFSHKGEIKDKKV